MLATSPRLNWMNGSEGVEIFNLGTGHRHLGTRGGRGLLQGLWQASCPTRSASAAPATSLPTGAMPPAERMMGWKAQYNIADMCRDSWHWQSQ